MKNLPKLPLEIWLMILKIKWQDRCNFLIALHKSPRNIDYHQPIKIDFSHGFPEVTNAIGYFEYYTMFNTTHIYCALTYPKIRNTYHVQQYALTYMLMNYFMTEPFYRGCRPVGLETHTKSKKN